MCFEAMYFLNELTATFISRKEFVRWWLERKVHCHVTDQGLTKVRFRQENHKILVVCGH